jgi:UTP--glucose-1-phosphate uridylyltransferase
VHLQGEILIRKVVVTAAGMGTRLLTVTKEQPKEMLPLFTHDSIDGLRVKPLLQIVFDQTLR